MSFEFHSKLPSPSEIREGYPLTEDQKKLKAERDREVADIITGKSDRFLLIIGPCSADNEDSVCDYVSRLAKVAEEVKDRIMVIPRIYTNKPRTTGEGYKGLFSQPDPEKKPDFLAGLIAMRKMQHPTPRLRGGIARNDLELTCPFSRFQNKGELYHKLVGF